MKNKINWPWMLTQIMIIVAVFAIALLIPYFTHLFDTLLGDKVTTIKTFSNDAQRINAFIGYFVYNFCLMMGILAVINIVFLVLEECITSWFEGSKLRMLLQAIVSLLAFSVFVVIVLQYLPSLALAKQLKLNDGALTAMMLCMLGGFVVQLAISMFVAIPSNRRGILGRK